MDEWESPDSVLRFGPYEADPGAAELRRNGAKIPLQDQPFQVLSVLLQNPGEIVRREELRDRVWPQDTFVEFDQALNTAIKKIRIALADDADAPIYIETVPRRGYRFIPVVTRVSRLPALGTRSARRISVKLAAIGTVFFGVVILVGLQMARLASAVTGFGQKRVLVAVIPFENWSSGSERVHLCDGLTQEIITQIGRLDPVHLEVAARAKVQPYEHSTRTLAEIGKELHVDYLMEGSLRSERQHVRVSAELIRVSDQARVWGDAFDRDDEDSLVLESEIAKSIVASIETKVLSLSSQ